MSQWLFAISYTRLLNGGRTLVLSVTVHIPRLLLKRWLKEYEYFEAAHDLRNHITGLLSTASDG